jgi:hypothetical protein
MANKQSRVLLLSLVVYTGAVCIVLINTTIGYLSLKEVKGTIKGISLDQNKATILKFSLQGDKNIYYQKYERRFFDQNSDKVKNQDSIHFYTLTTPQKKPAAISSLGDQSTFYYYPVFYINQPPGVLQIFLYHFYSHLILTILMLLSWALILYNGFSIALRSNFLSKSLLVVLTAAMLWLVI